MNDSVQFSAPSLVEKKKNFRQGPPINLKKKKAHPFFTFNLIESILSILEYYFPN